MAFISTSAFHFFINVYGEGMMEKTHGEIRRELAELEQKLQKVLDEPISKPGRPLGFETLRNRLMMISERLKRIQDLEKRIKGLKAKLT